MTRKDGRPRILPAPLLAEVAQLETEMTDAEWIDTYGGNERGER